MPKLTKRVIDTLQPGKIDQFEWDSELRGFGVRVKPSGVKSYLINYRNADGRSRRFTIGKHGALTPDQARRIARERLAAVARGEDPAAARQAKREAPTVAHLLERYLAEWVAQRNRPSTADGVGRIVRLHLKPALGHPKVAAVIRQDFKRLHTQMSGTPRLANLTLAYASKAFSLAEDWDIRPDGTNPCRRVERYPERIRERFLSDDELVKLGETLRLAETEGLPWDRDAKLALSKHDRKPENHRSLVPWQVIACVRLLLLTGCRRGEIVTMRWENVDLKEGLVTLLDTKSADRETLVLNSMATALLAGLPRVSGSPWVLPQGGDPSKPMRGDTVTGIWDRVRMAAGIPDVRLHDLRHTFGTYAGQSGANAFMVRDTMRHKTLAMTGRYVNRSADPVRALSNSVGARIAAGLEGKPSAEVLDFRSSLEMAHNGSAIAVSRLPLSGV